MKLMRGQKADVSKNRGLDRVSLYLGWETTAANMDIDGAAFLLTGKGVCERDEDFIFYGNPTSPTQAVVHAKLDGADKERIDISLRELPAEIMRIAVTLTIHEGERTGQYFQDVSNIYIRLVDPSTNEQLLYYEFGDDLQQEAAIVVGELYLHNGEWKFSAIGSGFNGGLAALCSHYGLEVEEEQEAVIDAVKPSFAEQPQPPVTVPFTLSKLDLKKKESVSIAKPNKITAKLRWDNNAKDLDLYCFYVTSDGVNDKIYYKKLGDANKAPYIVLDGDSRTAGTETITIHSTANLKYVLFCAYSALSNGFGSFNAMKARAEVDNHSGQTIVVPLLEKNKFSYWVAIAHIDFTDNQQMKISHVETYSKAFRENSPKLNDDGTFLMDKGPVEFKR